MGHKVFVSYKYKDKNVRPLPNVTPYTWGRDYVDVLEKLAEKHIYVRHFKIRGIDNYLRITVGTDEQTDIMLAEVGKILGK